MDLTQVVLITIILFPVLISSFELAYGRSPGSVVSRWACLAGSAFPFLLSIGLVIFLIDNGTTVSVSLPFLAILDLAWIFSGTPRSVGVLAVILLCFMLAQLIGRVSERPKFGSLGLVLLLQAGVTTMLLSRNLLGFAYVQIVSAFILFLIYRNALDDNQGSTRVRAWAAERFLGSQIVSGVLIIGIVTSTASVFGNGIFDFTKFRGLLSEILQNSSFEYLSLYFLAPFILALPVTPWMHWFSPLFEHRKVSPALNIIISGYLSVIAFVYFDIFYVVLNSQISQFDELVPVIGIILCAANLSFAVVEKSVRRKLSYTTAYLFAFGIYSLTFLDQSSYFIGMLLVVIVPVLALAYEYFSIKPEGGRVGKALFAGLVLFTLGMPGTPVYYFFALSASSAIQKLTTFSYASIFLWVLYVLTAVYCLYAVWSNRMLTLSGERQGLVMSRWGHLYIPISIGLLVTCFFSITIANLLGRVFV